MTETEFKRVAIIGVGLIGASLALAIKKRALSAEVVGFGRNEENLKRAKQRGIIDDFSLDHSALVETADLVVLATPVKSFQPILERLLPFVKRGTIITDVGSVKGALVEELEDLMPDGVNYVGGHPIAGSDRSGLDYASDSLFDGAITILTPTGKTPEDAIKRVKHLWEGVGSKVILMSPYEHDRIFALVSHLPHIVAYALVNTVSSVNKEYIQYAGKGFKDTTRIASSSPELWTDIVLQNRENLLEVISSFKDMLNDIEDALRNESPEKLTRLFSMARDLREEINNSSR